MPAVNRFEKVSDFLAWILLAAYFVLPYVAPREIRQPTREDGLPYFATRYAADVCCAVTVIALLRLWISPGVLDVTGKNRGHPGRSRRRLESFTGCFGLCAAIALIVGVWTAPDIVWIAELYKTPVLIVIVVIAFVVPRNEVPKTILWFWISMALMTEAWIMGTAMSTLGIVVMSLTALLLAVVAALTMKAGHDETQLRNAGITGPTS